MTVSELRQLLFDVKDQDATVKVDGVGIDRIETAYGGTLVRIIAEADAPLDASGNVGWNRGSR